MKQHQLKTLVIVFFAVLFSSSLSFAQHGHGSNNTQSDNKQKSEKVEDLPSGLSEMDAPEYKAIKMDSSESGHKMMDMKDHKMMDMKDHENMMTDSIKTEKSPIVRDGEIDLKAIDKNIDGKVFQDQMDWNVISDEAGECPLCGMKLKEVSLDKAKENLIKHDFKVKE